MKKKIVITGGHLTPALAVIDELIKRGGWEIFFIGRKYAAEGEKTPSVESQLIPQKGIWFIPIRAGRLQRRFTRYTIPAFLRIPLGFLQAFYHFFRLRPHLILSFGGYVSVPVVFAGWLLDIPIITHEQTTVQGLATKINTLFAKKVAVSWPQIAREFPPEKVVFTGNPLRKEIFRINEKLWRVLNFDRRLPLIFITGGNQGSHTINQVAKRALPKLLLKYNLFHQTGHLQALRDFEKLEGVREKLSTRLKKRYHLKKYLTSEEMGTILNKADLVVSRAGANIVTELAALAKPALLIPLPWLYQDEQTKNAQMLKEIGSAEILPQKNLSPQSLCQLIEQMMANLDRYKKNAHRAQKLVKLDAAQKIADLGEEILNES